MFMLLNLILSACRKKLTNHGKRNKNIKGSCRRWNFSRPRSRVLQICEEQHCYITCPIVTKKDGLFYDSSILLNAREKSKVCFIKFIQLTPKYFPTLISGWGSYTRTNQAGRFQNYFWTVGLQICLMRMDGRMAFLKRRWCWNCMLSPPGPFLNTLRNHAWLNHYYIVSEQEKMPRYWYDGDLIALTGEFAIWVCAPVNLEKEFFIYGRIH